MNSRSSGRSVKNATSVEPGFAKMRSMPHRRKTVSTANLQSPLAAARTGKLDSRPPCQLTDLLPQWLSGEMAGELGGAAQPARHAVPLPGRRGGALEGGDRPGARRTRPARDASRQALRPP